MKLPKLSSATVFAIATCLALIRDAEANAHQRHQNKDVRPKEHHHHSNNQKMEAQWNDRPKETCNEISLVCDSIVIDSITCHFDKHLRADRVGATSLNHHRQHHRDDCEKTRTIYIDMAKPCRRSPREFDL
ncbi:hypothetical protein BGZ98_008625, partial [Dissophora globulifera]